jgi:hypothetical protein
VKDDAPGASQSLLKQASSNTAPPVDDAAPGDSFGEWDGNLANADLPIVDEHGNVVSPEEAMAAQAAQSSEGESALGKYHAASIEEFAKFCDGVLTKCDDGWFYWIDGTHTRMTQEYPSFSVAKPEYHTPKQLTSAERANGVDPQPIEYSSEINATFTLKRVLKCPNDRECRRPSDWVDSLVDPYRIRSKKGKWEIRAAIGWQDLHPSVSRFDCSALPALKERVRRIYPDVAFHPVN